MAISGRPPGLPIFEDRSPKPKPDRLGRPGDRNFQHIRPDLLKNKGEPGTPQYIVIICSAQARWSLYITILIMLR